MTKTAKYIHYIKIPLALIIFTAIVGKLFFTIFEHRAWIPVVLFYWTAIGIIIFFDNKKNGKKTISYFNKLKPNFLALFLSVLVGFIPLPILLKYFHLIESNNLILLWISFALINPFFEEIFWRAYLLDKTPAIPFWTKGIISSLLFTYSHPLIWAGFSKLMLSPEMMVSLFIMAMTWVFTYRKTKSLLPAYFSHLLVDLFNGSILVFLNLMPVSHNF